MKTFKNVRGIYDHECTQEIFQRRGEDSNTRAKSYRLFNSMARLILRKYVSSNRVVNNWKSSRPGDREGGVEVKKFEIGLDKYWINHEQIFNYKENITSTLSSQH